MFLEKSKENVKICRQAVAWQMIRKALVLKKSRAYIHLDKNILPVADTAELENTKKKANKSTHWGNIALSGKKASTSRRSFL